MRDDTAKLILAVFIIVVAFAFGPWLTIQAINHLFGTSIEYTFWTWLSIIWLCTVFGGAARAGKS
jgi:flagellar biosynthesis protein FlhB